jgi:protein SCO1
LKAGLRIRRSLRNRDVFTDRKIVIPARQRLLLRAMFVIGLCSLALAGFAAYQLHGVPRFHGTIYPDAPTASPFTLTDQRGEATSLSDFEGRSVLLFFGFTRCPDVCPLTLGRLARIASEAEIGSDRLAILLLTVDPEHDSPARLAEYVEPFGPLVTAMTGEPAMIREVMAAYGAFAQEETGHHGAVTLAHTSIVFGIDEGGRLRVLIHADESPDLVEHDIRTLLRVRG